LKKAAKGGVPSAAYDLAIAYEKGTGVKKNPRLAFETYVLAALLGDAQSFYEVGRMYHFGIGVAKNNRLANHWRDKAESLGIDE
jgi:TPR repeat protein